MKAIIEDIFYTGLGAVSLNADRMLKLLDKVSYDTTVAEEEGKKIVDEWEKSSQVRKEEIEGKFEELSQKVQQSIGSFRGKAEDLTKELEELEATKA